MKYTEEIARTTKDPSILIDILRKGDSEYFCILAVVNRNCPPEILAEVLKRGKDDGVSRCAVRNPNCPPEARINWMYLTGRIEKEDPKKHIIEYEKIKEDNFQDLKDLL